MRRAELTLGQEVAVIHDGTIRRATIAAPTIEADEHPGLNASYYATVTIDGTAVPVALQSIIEPWIDAYIDGEDSAGSSIRIVNEMFAERYVQTPEGFIVPRRTAQRPTPAPAPPPPPPPPSAPGDWVAPLAKADQRELARELAAGDTELYRFVPDGIRGLQAIEDGHTEVWPVWLDRDTLNLDINHLNDASDGYLIRPESGVSLVPLPLLIDLLAHTMHDAAEVAIGTGTGLYATVSPPTIAKELDRSGYAYTCGVCDQPTSALAFVTGRACHQHSCDSSS